MAGLTNHRFFAARFIAALLLLCCISPSPDPVVRKTGTFQAQVTAVPGEPRLVISKSRYTLTLYKGTTMIKTYKAVFGGGYSDGDKRMSGDRRTPEGEFYVCTMSHSKRFYKFIGLSYPALKHAESGLQNRLITREEYALIKKAINTQQPPPWGTRLGGAIGIHGRMPHDGSSQQRTGVNWTDGCIALANTDVEELFSVVSPGTPVTVLP